MRWPKRTMEERFWSKVHKTDGCWIWLGFKMKTGHGRFGTKTNTSELAHRVSFRLANGYDAYHACHTCDNASCVRPDHLYDGDQGTNMRDCVARGRHANTKKTHCKHGHALTPENVYVFTGRGKKERQCLACKRRNNLASWRRKRDAKFTPQQVLSGEALAQIERCL